MKPIYLFFLLIFSFNQAQNCFIKINDNCISFEDFELYEQENLKNFKTNATLNSFIQTELLKQAAIHNNVDIDSLFLKWYHNELAPFQASHDYPPSILNPLMEEQKKRLLKDKEIQLIFYPYTDKNIALKEIEKIQNDIKSKKITYSQAIEKYSKYKYYLTPSLVSAFNLPYEVETEIWNTKIGNEIKPIDFGDMWIFGRVISERENLGEIYLSGIEIYDKTENGKQKIDSIYQLIKTGEISYEAAVRRFNKNPTVINEYGNLPLPDKPFSNDIYTWIKSAKTDDILPPKLTDNGYIIYRFHAKKPYHESPKYDESIKYKILENLSQKYNLNQKLIQYLKNYNLCEFNEDVYNNYINSIDSISIKNKALLYDNTQQPVLKLGKDSYWTKDITEKIWSKIKLNPQLSLTSAELKQEYNDLIMSSITEQIKLFYINNLLLFPETKGEQYNFDKNHLNEYFLTNYVNIPLTSYPEKLEEFYQNNKQNYTRPEHFEANVFKCNTEAIATEVLQMIQQKKQTTDILDRYLDQVNQYNEPVIFLTNGKFNKGLSLLPPNIDYNKNLQIIPYNNQYYVIDIKKQFPAGYYDLNEIKADLILDFQAKEFDKIINSQKSSSKITIDENLKQTLINKYGL